LKRAKRRGKKPQRKIFIKAPRINENIRAEKLRVVGDQGENLGIITREEALEEAKKRELDLVEVTDQTDPPVAKITSYDKYRYQLEKAEKEKQKKQKTSELKNIRITPRSAKNDLETKMKKVVEFLEEGDKVEILIFLKGREKANKDWAKGKLVEFLEGIPFEYKVLVPIKYAGRGFAVQIIKNKNEKNI